MDLIRSKNNQVFRNITANIWVGLFVALINLWIVRFLVTSLGFEQYGLIIIIMVVVDYFGIISNSITLTVSRFLTIEIHQDKQVESKITMGTAFFCLVIFIILQTILIITIFIIFSDSLFAHTFQTINVSFLIFTIVCSYFLNIFSSLFSTILFAHNKTNIKKYIELSTQIIKISLIVVLFKLLSNDINYFGLSLLLSSVFNILMFYLLYKKLTPLLPISLSYFRRKRLLEFIKMSKWVLLNNIGYLLLLRLDLLVINWIKGLRTTGEYASIQKLNSMYRVTGSMFSSVVSPLIYISIGRKDYSKCIKILYLSIQISTIFYGIIAGVICGFYSNIIFVWLSEPFEQYRNILYLLIIPTFITLSVQPIFSLQTALDRVKIPAIATLLTGMFNILLIFLFLKFEYGIIGVVFASAIAIMMRDLMFTPIYASIILEQKAHYFFSPISKGILTFCTVGTGSFLASNQLNNLGLSSLLIVILLIIVTLFAVAWFALFNQSERCYLYKLFFRNGLYT